MALQADSVGQMDIGFIKGYSYNKSRMKKKYLQELPAAHGSLMVKIFIGIINSNYALCVYVR